MTAIAGLSLADLEKTLSPLPRFRANQIYKWITKGACKFEEMKNIPVSLQTELAKRFVVFSGSISGNYDDNETKKIVLTLEDGAKIEAVLLSDEKKRLTACLSTQVGCPAGCVFCKTGSLGFKRNLFSYEITEQLLHLRNTTNANRENGHIIDNIVIMGMGEPLLNLDNLRKAILVFTDSKGLNLSRRRITVSTCGICDNLFDLAKNGPFIRLALSLTTADETLRERLMPVTKANPLEKIRKALLLFQKNGGGRITLEIPLLALEKSGGLNTREKDAQAIALFANGLDTVINIIPWNPVEGLEFEGEALCRPGKEEINKFIGMLESRKLKVTKRLHKGQNINGACGQLGSLT